MRKSRLARLLVENKPAVGVWMTLCDSGIPIILAGAGYDWIMIDTEHNPFTDTQLQNAIYALRDSDVTPIIRVRDNNRALIKFALDIGAGGVVVPMIEDEKDARQAVKFSKYPPLGSRGYGPLRATDFWAHKKEYDSMANKGLLLICQIECSSAVDRLEEIFQVPGIDGFYIGPNDLSHSMGYGSNMRHPEVVKAIDRVIDVAQKYQRPWGMPVTNADEFRLRIRQGAKLLTIGADNRFLKSAANAAAIESFQSLSRAGLRELTSHER